ncbi:thiamine phosphate synthase [Candidatus Omnitrophota bacterium]
MISRKKRLQSFKLYAVTDIKKYDSAYVRKIEAALRGGVDIVQLRSKYLSDNEFFRLGKKIKPVVDKYNKLFFVNDRPDMCKLLAADGVHIGQDDLPVDEIRSIIPKGRLVGKSTHSVAQAVATMKEDVDYIGFGPLFGTPTKPDYIPVGLKNINKVMKYATVPVVFIGGINHDNLEDVVYAGAKRIAVVRALFAQENIQEKARQLKMKLV